jgi:DNA-binding PadR family transcriptional regulator
MTWQTRAVLKLLLDDLHGRHYGLEIAEGVGLPTGSVYPILARLEQAGWVTSEWENIDPAVAGRRRRRYYRLTASGAERAAEYAQAAPTPVWTESPPSGGTTPRRGWPATPGWTST